VLWYSALETKHAELEAAHVHLVHSLEKGGITPPSAYPFMACMGHQYLDSVIRLEILKNKWIACAIDKLNVTHPAVFVFQEDKYFIVSISTH
jgi:hypothetical protein